MNEYTLLKYLGEELPGLLWRDFQKRNLCILATRICIEVGMRCGIKLYPQPVRLMVCNKHYADFLVKYGRPPAPSTHTKPRWSVGIGYGSKKSGWDGYLVVRSDNFIMDPTINQTERKKYKIEIPGFLIVPPAGLRARWQELLYNQSRGSRMLRVYAGLQFLYGTGLVRAGETEEHYRGVSKWALHSKRSMNYG